jgi:hypothetical protein
MNIISRRRTAWRRVSKTGFDRIAGSVGGRAGRLVRSDRSGAGLPAIGKMSWNFGKSASEEPGSLKSSLRSLICPKNGHFGHLVRDFEGFVREFALAVR